MLIVPGSGATISHKKKHQGEQSNHNHCKNVEVLIHLITQAQQTALSFSLNAFLFLTLSSCFQVCVCCFSMSLSLYNYFYFYLSSLLLPPPCLPTSLHPSTAHAFKNRKADIFSFIHPQASYPLISWKRALFLLHVFFFHPSLFIRPSSSPWWDCHYGSGW